MRKKLSYILALSLLLAYPLQISATSNSELPPPTENVEDRLSSQAKNDSTSPNSKADEATSSSETEVAPDASEAEETPSSGKATVNAASKNTTKSTQKAAKTNKEPTNEQATKEELKSLAKALDVTAVSPSNDKVFTLKNESGAVVNSYDSLNDAINAMNTTNTYSLELNKDYEVKDNESFTLDNKKLCLKSSSTTHHTIKKIGKGHILELKNAAQLTVENIIFDGNYDNNHKSGNYGGSCFVVDNSNLELNDNAVIQNFVILKSQGYSNDNGGFTTTTNDDAYPAIYLKENSVLTINGASIQNNTHTTLNIKGGAIHAAKGTTITIKNGTFTANKSYHEYGSYQGAYRTEYIRDGNDGGFIYSLGKVEITGGTFTSNRAYNSGGAIYVKGSLNIKGSETNKVTFTDNKASKYDEDKYQQADYSMGGAIYAEVDSNINIEYADFTQNIAKHHGGVLYLKAATDNVEDTIKNCTFDKNTSMYQAGAVWSNTKLKIANTKFSQNKALDKTNSAASGNPSEGGAIYTTKDIEVNSCEFTNNSCERYTRKWGSNEYEYISSGNGGAINCAKATITDSNFSDNHASNGGALCCHELSLTGNTNGKNKFADNSAGDRGGAILCSSIKASNYIFAANRVGTFGGAISCSGESNITSCEFKDNKAKDADDFNNNNGQKEGGAIYYRGSDNSSATLTIEKSTFTKNIAKNGGAIHAKGNLTVNECKFSENEVEMNQGEGQLDYMTFGRGGAIFIEKDKLTVSKSEFNNNKAIQYGGAICSDLIHQNKADTTSTISITESSFTANNAKQGGAIYTARKLSVNTSTINENSANLGGGIFAKAESELNDTSFSKNKAVYSTKKGSKGYGGALYIYMAAITKITNSTFNENNSINGGGIFLFYKLVTGQETARIEITSSKFSKNTATNGGGAIANAISKDEKYTGNKISPEIDIKKSQFIENSVSNYGGAIYYEVNQYSNNITEEQAYKRLKTDSETDFIKNQSTKGSFVPPANYDKFTELKFSANSDVAKSMTARQSLLNNNDVNFENSNVKTIIYDCNGGKFADGKKSASSVHEINTTIIIKEAPSKSGYKFLYWKGSKYNPGDSYTVIDNHTFVAQWEKEQPKPTEPDIPYVPSNVSKKVIKIDIVSKTGELASNSLLNIYLLVTVATIFLARQRKN